MRPARLPIVLLATAALAVLLGGCTFIKPGSVALTQPAGIGPAHLRLVVCTQNSEGAVESEKLVCGPYESESAEAVQSQMLLVLSVPAGTGAAAPATIAAAPSPGAAPTTFTRSQEVAQAFVAASNGALPAPGFELAGYISGAISEVPGQTFEWTLETDLALPVPADGGSYGGPFTVAALSGWRGVGPTEPANRPVVCVNLKELEEKGALPASGDAFCEPVQAGNQPSLGVSDLKIKPPVGAVAAPGRRPSSRSSSTSPAAPPPCRSSPWRQARSCPVPGSASPTPASAAAPPTSPPGARRRPPARRSSRCRRPPASAATRWG